VFDLIYRTRHALRLGGLALLVVGLAVTIGIDTAAGLGLVALAAVVLALVQPLVLARMRSRQARRRAPRNGHGPGADAQDVDLT
jgi:membrane protein implicated in regulation of membrane protease activity